MRQTICLQRCHIESPLGGISLLSSPKGLVALSWDDRWEQTKLHLSRHLGDWSEQVVEHCRAAEALSSYLSGMVDALKDTPIDPVGTDFQRRVWRALATIPVGTTWSYKRLASEIGQPSAYRAAANANGKNPLPLFIPCHRVIAADGSIGGFSAGLQRKVWLLKHESHQTYLGID